jgi:phage virion morphogenesis protein
MKIEVDDAIVRASFARMQRIGGDPANYLRAVGGVIKESTRMRFETSTAPDGSKWKPVLRGGMPLRNTGTHLMNALSFQVQGNAVTVGVPYAWASVHQYGKTIVAKNKPFLVFKINGVTVFAKRVTIPARPFLGISPIDRFEIREALKRSILPQ